MNTPHRLSSLPIFPLHAVLFPQGYLPLRIFEPRYRSMVHSCREHGAPFGVVTLLSGKEVASDAADEEVFHPAGTIAFIDRVTPLSTGLELIECTGHERFQVMATHRIESNLWLADVELMPADTACAIPPDLSHDAKALRHVLHKQPRRSMEAIADREFADCGWVANRWCELLPMSLQHQLQLLELNSPLLRLELVTDALVDAGILS